MKAPSFRYHAADSLEDALDVLARNGDDAQILAGGQSLMPVLAFRLAAPALLVDINRVDSLRGIEVGEGFTRVGALARHAEVEASPVIREHLPLIADAVRQVAHPAVRNRGTFGGSVALADPAAEFPACCVALDAQIVLESAARGRRAVPAEQFYRGLFETDRAPDEVVVEIRFPARHPRDRYGFVEFSRRHGDFAISGMALRARLASDEDAIDDLRLVAFGSEPYPRVLRAAADAAHGRALDGDMFAEVADAAGEEIDPMPTPGAGVAFKRHLARTLSRRALAGLPEAVP